MIYRDKGEFIAECNECGDCFYGGVVDDFHAFIKELKGEGWIANKVDDEWIHLCSECH